MTNLLHQDTFGAISLRRTHSWTCHYHLVSHNLFQCLHFKFFCRSINTDRCLLIKPNCMYIDHQSSAYCHAAWISVCSDPLLCGRLVRINGTSAVEESFEPFEWARPKLTMHSLQAPVGGASTTSKGSNEASRSDVRSGVALPAGCTLQPWDMSRWHQDVRGELVIR